MVKIHTRCTITLTGGSTVSVSAPGGKWREFFERTSAGSEPETSMLSIGSCCLGCGTPEPPDAYAKGWRSRTCPIPPDFHALFCPTCERSGRVDEACVAPSGSAP